PVKGPWRKTRAPRIDLEAAWLEHVGDVRCDLLKVDIEGSERDLVRAERAFLRRVDRIVLEWHTWIVSHAELEAALSEQVFALEEVLEERETTGIALYGRRG
ncbi:MAG: FkbM family methyltransferase, partial [Planctomycetes bacterium]|nr:FkbM family methyltransferase [Planctomycetota bacterium]